MSKYCPSCGEELVDSAKFCKNCGTNLEKKSNPNQQNFKVPVVEKDRKLMIILGYAFSVLMPIIGVIIGIYLATRKDSQNAQKHGKYIIIVAIVIWIISAITSIRYV